MSPAASILVVANQTALSVGLGEALRARLEEGGARVEKFDAMLQSKRYRILMRAGTAVGIFAIVAGIVFLITE